MYHDLSPRSYLKGQGHSAHVPKTLVWAITFYCQVGSEYHFTQLLSMTQGRVMTFTQGHIAKVRLTVHMYPKYVSGQLLLIAKLDLDNISHNCCLWPKSVSWPWHKVIHLQGQGHSAHIPKIHVRAITPHCQVGSGYYFTQLLSLTQGCLMTLIQGHISKVKVTVLTCRKSVPRP